MLRLHTNAYVSNRKSFNGSTPIHDLSNNDNTKRRPTCEVKINNNNNRKGSRRLVTLRLFFSHFSSLILFPSNANAGSFLDKYVKRKKLDPLETYVPAVILAELQITDLETTLDVDQPQFANYRYVLRSGPAASLRVNIRAVAQYASDAGNGQAAFNDVDQCLRALEELDSLFLRASRNEPGASVKSMKTKIADALNALDSLLQTVPTEVLDKGKAIADAYRSAEVEPETEDPDLKKLEGIM